ncbi:hypothetical protein [Nocardia australiensis]|uniref:hypothetical protein n=1 Tax=Nocardia australiensis TaxID=2887191 RepID=UPI001D135703|nr:hypothetical protein [Nocardia australiensis]
MKNNMPSKAIGVLSLDVTGPHLLRDERVITELAQRRGYTLTGLVTISDDTFMPTALIVSTARGKGAVAVIAPSMAHVNNRVRAIALACDLITPTKFVACTSTDRSPRPSYE